MKGIAIIIIVGLFSFSLPAFANGLPDGDRDGVPDRDEKEIYHTNPASSDTDGDGFKDFEEITTGYSPVNPKPVRLIDSDIDNDGLTEAWEIKFKSDPFVADTDGDGKKDGEEVDKGYDPVAGEGAKLTKSLRISLGAQKLDYLLNGYSWKSFPISSGRPDMPTTKGEFIISNKIEKAWSKSYGLWMPYWLGLAGTRMGIHELPVWPNGYREGENHLGKPVSHGCVRLGVGAAKYIYERMEPGEKVEIVR
ncbi:MAG: L,D-transpeptidase family protein [Bacillota bacterium]